MNNPTHRVNTTKRLLRDALMELLRDKPLRSITVKELCALAKLNRGTFYAHYADVYDLMEQIEAEMEADFLAAIEPMLTVAEPPSLPRMVKQVFECIETNADLFEVMIGPYGDKEFGQNLLAKSKEKCLPGCMQRFPNADLVRIERYFTFITGGCYALMERWTKGGMKESPAELASAAERIMECGIGFLEEA